MNLNILDTHTHTYNPHRRQSKFTPLNVPFTEFNTLENINIADNYFSNEKIAALKLDYLGNCFATHFINLFAGFEYNNFTPFDVYRYTGDEFNNVQLFLFYLMKHDLIRCDGEELRICTIDVLTIKDGGELPVDPPANTAGKIKFLEDSLLYLEQKAGTGESLAATDAFYNAVKSMLDGLKQGFLYEAGINILTLTTESPTEAVLAAIGDWTELKQAVIDGKIIKIGTVLVSNSKLAEGNIAEGEYDETENEVSLVFNEGLKTKKIVIKQTNIETEVDGETVEQTVYSAVVSEEALPDNIATQEYVQEKVAALGTVFNFKGTVASKDDLPAADNKAGDFYLVGTDADNMAEYVWVDDRWEMLGTRQDVDLSALATKTELTDGLALKADKADTYTKTEVDDLLDNVEVDTSTLATKEELTTGLAGKQDTLTAGANITIADGVISATGGTTVDTSNLATKTELTDGLALKQNILTAGDNITITGNTISADATTDYTELTNKPQINSVELTGNKTLADLGINIPTVITSYNGLTDKPSINGVTLEDNKTTDDLGIIIPDISNLATKQEMEDADVELNNKITLANNGVTSIENRITFLKGYYEVDSGLLNQPSTPSTERHTSLDFNFYGGETKFNEMYDAAVAGKQFVTKFPSAFQNLQGQYQTSGYQYQNLTVYYYEILDTTVNHYSYKAIIFYYYNVDNGGTYEFKLMYGNVEGRNCAYIKRLKYAPLPNIPGVPLSNMIEIMPQNWNPTIPANTFTVINAPDTSAGLIKDGIQYITQDLSTGYFTIKNTVGNVKLNVELSGGNTSGSGGCYVIIQSGSTNQNKGLAYNPDVGAVNSLPTVSATFMVWAGQKFRFVVWRATSGTVNWNTQNMLRITFNLYLS